MMNITTSGIGLGNITPTSFVHVVPTYSGTGDLSGAGYGLRFAAATYTNTTTAASGTVAAASAYSFGTPTITSTNTGVIYTNFSTLKIDGAPIAGTNSTITTPWALRVESGNAYFGSNITNQGTLTNGGAITATSNNHRFGWLMVLTSGTPGATGQGIRITGPDTEFEIQGTGASVLNTFSFANYISKTGMRNLSNVHPVNSFVRIYGGYTAPNANNLTGAVLSITPQYDISTQSGANVKGLYYNPTLTNMSTVATHYAWESTAGDFLINGGRMGIGVTSFNAAVLLDLVSTTRGLLIPRATTAQINAVTTPPVGLQMFSTDDERIHLKRTSGFFQIAYTQDIKRDTVHKTVNANLDLSGLTSTWKTRNKRVTIEAILTAAATGNIDITLPPPTADLVGIRFDVSVEDTSGDSDISVLQFGTDGVDGYLYNGDGTFQTSQNLFPGLGVYFGVYWCEAKSAYRWKLQ